MSKYPGRIISATPPTVSVSEAKGIWTLDEALQYEQADTWPKQITEDPYFNQTTLLLHGDGTNGAQNNTFLDSSTPPKTITRNGNTTQGSFSPFSVAEGQWSNYFDGTGDYLDTDSTLKDLGTGDFCIEFWLHLSGTTGMIIDTRTDANVGWMIYVNPSTEIVFYHNALPRVDTPIQTNVWTHYAITRSSGTLRLFVDGTQADSATYTTNLSDGDDFRIGYKTNSGSSVVDLKGYLSNLSVVIGSAIYTSGFTPSTTPLSPSTTNQKLLTCYSNRFVDANTATTAKTITPAGNVSVQPFSPFAPSAAYSASTNGGSGYFDGGSDYLQVSDAALALSTGDFSIQFWVYNNAFDGSSGINTLIDYRNGSDPVISPVIFTTNGQLFFRTNGSNVISGSTLKLYEWSFIGISRSSGTTKMFVNGVQVGSDYSDTNNYTSSVIRIGADNDATLNQELNGYMSGLKITQGAAVNFSTLGIPTAPPTADANTELLLNFTNAGIFDNTGKNNLETVADAQINTTTKKFGTGSMEFDGTGDYLAIPNSANLNFESGDFTIEFWLYPSSVSGSQALVSLYGYSNNRRSWYVGLDNDELELRYDDDGTSATIFNSASGTIVINQWQHIAYVRNGSSFKGYIDGVEVCSSTSSVSLYNNTVDPVHVGVVGPNLTEYFTGFIDDLRITKGVARYTTTFTPPTSAFLDK